MERMRSQSGGNLFPLWGGWAHRCSLALKEARVKVVQSAGRLPCEGMSRLHISSDLFRGPQEEPGGGTSGQLLRACCHHDPILDKWIKMDGWMELNVFFCWLQLWLNKYKYNSALFLPTKNQCEVSFIQIYLTSECVCFKLISLWSEWLNYEELIFHHFNFKYDFSR